MNVKGFYLLLYSIALRTRLLSLLKIYYQTHWVQGFATPDWYKQSQSMIQCLGLLVYK